MAIAQQLLFSIFHVYHYCIYVSYLLWIFSSTHPCDVNMTAGFYSQLDNLYTTACFTLILQKNDAEEKTLGVLFGCCVFHFESGVYRWREREEKTENVQGRGREKIERELRLGLEYSVIGDWLRVDLALGIGFSE